MKIGVIGTGAWGTALAQVLTDNGNSVLMWGKEQSQVENIKKHHKNPFYFGDEVVLSKKIKATNNLNEVIDFASVILLSVPTIAMRSVLEQILPLLNKKVIFVNTSKGFDPKTNERMSTIIREVIPEEKRGEVVSLIGPSHAEEVILRHLTLVCSVSKSLSKSRKIQKLFSNDYFRVYTLKDEVGAEMGVAMKNCIAIASGIIDGLGFGDNAKAALVTRGLKEMITLGTFYGGKEKTYLGLTGIGDLMVTCNSKHSRNYRCGYQIGLADSAEEFLKDVRETVEGIRTTRVLHEICKANNIESPIVEAIYGILYENKRPSESCKLLMVRPLKAED